MKTQTKRERNTAPLALEYFLAADDVNMIVAVIERKHGKLRGNLVASDVRQLLAFFPVANKDRDGTHLNADLISDTVYVGGTDISSQQFPVWNITDGWLPMPAVMG